MKIVLRLLTVALITLAALVTAAPANASTSIKITMTDFTPVEGVQYDGNVATFSITPCQDGGLPTFSVTIDWGDGSTSQVGVSWSGSCAGNTFSVDGAHTLSNDN